MDAQLWSKPPAQPAIQAHTVDIWLADLDRASAHLVEHRTILIPDEQAKADRFIRPNDRDHYIAGRAILRRLLSSYTQIPPAEIVIDYQERGKPIVAISAIQFNLSHSNNIALYAFSGAGPVGIDVEHVRDTRDIGALARTVLGADELAFFNSHSEQEQIGLFFRYWTLKEALIKAEGGSLDDVRRIAVQLGSRMSEKPISATKREAPTTWDLYELSPLTDYAAALATSKDTTTLRFWRTSYAP